MPTATGHTQWGSKVAHTLTFAHIATFADRVKVDMTVKDAVDSVLAPLLADWADVTIVPNQGGARAAVVTVTTADGKKYAIELKWAGQGWPSDVRRVLDQQSHSEWPRHLVVVARNLSPGALQLLSEHNANWMDQAGQVRLMVPPGLFVYRESRDSKPKSRTLRFEWSRSAVQLAEYILDLPRDQPLRTGDLAEATDWSPGRVSTVLGAFDALDWTEPKGAKSGPGAWRRLTNPGGMLDSWAAHVGNQPRRKRLAHHPTTSLLRFTETELARFLGEADSRAWGLTTWAGLELVAPFATAIPVVHIYLTSDGFRSDLDGAIRKSGLREVDEGARFEFWEADSPLLTQPGQPAATPVVATPRLYADLLALGARGADAAQHLRETKFDF